MCSRLALEDQFEFVRRSRLFLVGDAFEANPFRWFIIGSEIVFGVDSDCL